MLRAKNLVACIGLFSILAGCGTTRTTNTQRTATEQLLISDAIDRTVQLIDFTPLANEAVFFDDRRLYNAVDSDYLISSLRQQMLASGCLLKEKREDATYVVEPRVGAVGTDSHNLLFGFPATNVPQLSLLQALPPAIPEIPIAKRRNQRGVVKIAVFAYRRDTGEPAWQSGIATNQSTDNNIWILGAGPFKRGTIHQGISFANGNLARRLARGKSKPKPKGLLLGQAAVFRGAPSKRTDPTSPAKQDIQRVAAIEPEGSQPQPRKPQPPRDKPAGHQGPAQGPTVLPPPRPSP